jgi:hypothetical protein
MGIRKAKKTFDKIIREEVKPPCGKKLKSGGSCRKKRGHWGKC